MGSIIRYTKRQIFKSHLKISTVMTKRNPLTNGGYAMRLLVISWTGTEGLISLNCDRPLHSGIRVPELQ